MTDGIQQSVQPREASLPLLIGIVALPMVFSWFLLGKGYSRPVRAVGFTWMAIFTSITLGVATASDDPPQAAVSAAKPAEAAGVPPKNAAAADMAAAAKHSDTEAAENEFRRLYSELQAFRHDRSFLDVGFDQCCRFHDWQVRVQKLDRKTDAEMLGPMRVTPGDLQTLGFEYLRNKGRSTELAADLESRLQLALYPPRASPEHGIVNDLTQGCRNFELVAQFFRLSEEGAYSTADAVLHGPGCEKVLAGTRTGPVLKRQSYRFRSGGSSDQILVRLASGQSVWLDEDDVDFR